MYYSISYDDSVVFRVEFLVDILVYYWLLDNDFLLLVVNVCKLFGMSFLFRLVLGEILLVVGLGEVVKLFIKYLNLSLVVGIEGFD